jgi:multidrug efflux pump subunit AcrA (membrane-fusion protein)
MTGTPISIPGPGARARPRRKRLAPGRIVRWVIPVLLALALVAWLIIRSLNASGAESDRYATATATRADVTETYEGSGTVQKTDQASVGFPSAGTVTRVSVALRQHVKAGQELARMDNTDLKIAVIQAKQALADAEVNLESAQNAAASVSTSAARSAPTTSSSTSSPASRGTSSTTGGSSSSSASRRSGTSSGAGGAAAKSRQLSRTVSAAQARLNSLNALVAHDFAVQQATCAPLLGVAAPAPVSPPTHSSPPAQSTPPARHPTWTHPVTATTSPAGAHQVTSTPSPTGTATATATPSSTPTTTHTATPTPSSSRTPTHSPTGSPSPTHAPSPTSSGPSSQRVLAACVSALVGTMRAEHEVIVQQGVLDRAVQALVNAALQSAQSGVGTNGSSTGGNQFGGTGGSQSGGSGGLSAGQTRSGTTSSQQGRQPGGQGTLTVASAEAAVTKAKLTLASAEAKLKGATIAAPISGTVSALPFAKGDTVTTSDQIVIIGKGAVEVQMNVPEAAFRTLAAGERAELVTPGGGRAAGIVTRLGLLPDDSSSGSTTFPVLVAATGSDATTLPAGAAASVTVTLGVSRNVVVLPVSAVTRTGSTGTVQVLDNGVLTRADVTLGRVGLATIEITSGLRAGQTVVVADNTVALPTINLRGLRGGGGLGGGTSSTPRGGR